MITVKPNKNEKGVASLPPPLVCIIYSKLRFTVSAQVRGSPGEKLDVPAEAE